jgi:CDP-6-deoxy-D-xylo-4-hexulose-3-dehydrase
MIVTGDDAVRDDLRSLRSHGWIRDRSDRATWTSEHPEVDERFMFVMPGYNVRATEIQGAIGQIQLQRLDGMLERREALARKVRDWLAKSAPWLRLVGADQLPGENQPVARRARTHSWMTLPLMLDAGAPLGAPGLRAFFAERDVESRPIIAGNLARHPASRRIKSRSAASLARCDEVFTRGLMLGCHPVPTPGSIETLENAIAALARL